MLMDSPRTNVATLFDGNAARPLRSPMPLPVERRSYARARHDERSNERARRRHEQLTTGGIDSIVEIFPAGIAARRAVAWDGMAAEIVQATKCERIELWFRAPRHMLVLYEQGARREGETLVEGSPRSTLRDLKGKLTFVPAGHEYYDCHEPRSLARVVYFYFDPTKMPAHPETRVGGEALAPRLFFEDAAVWDTAYKLISLIDGGGSDNQRYFEALGTVLAHELVRLNVQAPRIEAPIRGGLAGWQQRTVIAYIEEHLAEQIALATLARLVRLSPYHFCRAFKQSFGLPPHRYHNQRRIEEAKLLLAKHAPSVTEIGLTLGYGDTSSFTAAFRRATGLTPTAYHRSLA
jgi:AraC family transcriptional regulator